MVVPPASNWIAKGELPYPIPCSVTPPGITRLCLVKNTPGGNRTMPPDVPLDAASIAACKAGPSSALESPISP